MKKSVSKFFAVSGLSAVLALGAAGYFWKESAPDRKQEPTFESESSSALTAKAATEEFLQRIPDAKVRDYPKLVRLLMFSGDSDLLAKWMPELLQEWLESDPRSLLAFLHDLEVTDPTGEKISLLAPYLLEILPDLSDRVAGSVTLLAILERVIMNSAKQDPEQALQWAREWLVGRGYDAALAGIILHLVAKDPAQAQALVGEIETLPNRLAASLAIAEFLGANDPEEGVRWADSLTDPTDRAYALVGVLAAMSKENPVDAAAIYEEKASEIQRAFTEKLLAERELTGWDLEGEFEGLTLEEARRALLNLPDPNVHYFRRAAFEIGANWGETNPVEAMEWAQSLPLAQGSVEARAAVLENWVQQDPQAAWSAFQEDPAPAPLMAQQLFASWATQQSSAASQALLTVPSGTLRQAAIQGYIEGWSDSGASANQLAQWSASLPSSAEQDTARKVVAESVAFDNPIIAWQQVQQIQDPQSRFAAFSEIFPSLAEANSALAREALKTISMPAVQREYFESLLPAVE